MTKINKPVPRKSLLSPRYLASKILEKGIVWCLRAALRRMSNYVDRLTRRITWMFPALYFLFRPVSKSEKRILAIWDFRTVPYSIGDLIVLHEKTQILRLKHKADKVDICFVCNPEKPVRKLGEQGITRDNFHYHLPDLVSTVYLNAHIGSFFLFDSHKELDGFVADNVDRYHTWPTFLEYSGKRKAYALNFNSIQDFYRKNGFVPNLDCRPSTLEWAYTFYKEHVRPQFPVVVHLRNNPLSSASRNAPLDSWLGFFNSCDGKFDVKFILIGAVGEIDERFRGLPNVLVAKDYHTTVEQDLVLAYSALIYMGSSSGPGAVVLFGQTPYLIFGYVPANESVPYKGNFSFATDTQKLIWDSETADILMKEFSKLFSRVDKTNWETKAKNFFLTRSKRTFLSDLRWAE